MINHETQVYNKVASKLRDTFENIYISGTESSSLPSKFPSVVIKLEDNPIVTQYSDFQSVENVTEETYYFEVTSNLTKGKEKQCKDIVAVINEVMVGDGFYRSFNNQIAALDTTLCRRIARYRKYQTED